MAYNTNSNAPPTLQPGQQVLSTNTLDHHGQIYDTPGKVAPVRIHLTPIAPPSALGLASYASSTFIVGTWLASWYGNEVTPLIIWPFILTFGGLGQFASGMWAFKARDTLGSVFHTMWGSAWLAMGLFLAYAGAQESAVNRYAYNDAWAIWMVPLSVLTYVLTAAAVYRDMVWAGITFTLATGSLLGVLGWFIHEPAVLKLTGYFWIVSSAMATYRVALYVLHEARPDRDILPRFQHNRYREHCGKGYHHGYNEPGVLAGY